MAYAKISGDLRNGITVKQISIEFELWVKNRWGRVSLVNDLHSTIVVVVCNTEDPSYNTVQYHCIW